MSTSKGSSGAGSVKHELTFTIFFSRRVAESQSRREDGLNGQLFFVSAFSVTPREQSLVDLASDGGDQPWCLDSLAGASGI